MNRPLNNAPTTPHGGLLRGFLPAADPLPRLPAAFAAWDEAAAQLPKLLVCGQLPQALAGLPPFAVERLSGEAEWERAMLLLSFLGHAYVWGSGEPAPRLPEGLAVPWQRVARRLGRPPVLSYASYALNNWRRLDPAGPVALGNIALLQNFLGGLDEEWFVLVHVEIEAKAAPALAALRPAQAAARQLDGDALERHLGSIAAALTEVCRSLERMPEHCDPYIYYTRVRPYLHGWKDNPALPVGLIYAGVAEYGEVPQRFRGETGAQSAIIPALDGALGIAHAADPLRAYLEEMREYMTPRQRAFLDAVEKGHSLRTFVASQPRLRPRYNACIGLLQRFRSKHLEFAASYVQKQSQHSALNPTAIGTGGTPFMEYLQKHKRETADHYL